MNTHASLPHPACPSGPPVREWWRALQRRLATLRAPRRVHDRLNGLDSLIELDARTLDDIGAPEPLRSRAQAHRDAQQRVLNELRAGVGGAGWRHW